MSSYATYLKSALTFGKTKYFDIKIFHLFILIIIPNWTIKWSNFLEHVRVSFVSNHFHLFLLVLMSSTNNAQVFQTTQYFDRKNVSFFILITNWRILWWILLEHVCMSFVFSYSDVFRPVFMSPTEN